VTKTKTEYLSKEVKDYVLKLKDKYPWYDAPLTTLHLQTKFPKVSLNMHQVSSFLVRAAKKDKMGSRDHSTAKGTPPASHIPSVEDQQARASLDWVILNVVRKDKNEPLDTKVTKVMKSTEYHKVMGDMDLRDFGLLSRAKQLAHYGFTIGSLDNLRHAKEIDDLYNAVGRIEDTAPSLNDSDDDADFLSDED
jgi:hypothetical protein